MDQPAELGSTVGMDHCNDANLDHEPDDLVSEPHQYGVANLSDCSILDCTNTNQPKPEGWEQSGALSMTIDLRADQQILVINTHLWAG